MSVSGGQNYDSPVVHSKGHSQDRQHSMKAQMKVISTKAFHSVSPLLSVHKCLIEALHFLLRIQSNQMRRVTVLVDTH